MALKGIREDLKSPATLWDARRVIWVWRKMPAEGLKLQIAVLGGDEKLLAARTERRSGLF